MDMDGCNMKTTWYLRGFKAFQGSYLPEILIDIDNLMDVDEESDEDTDESSAELDSYIYDSESDDNDN